MVDSGKEGRTEGRKEISYFPKVTTALESVVGVDKANCSLSQLITARPFKL